MATTTIVMIPGSTITLEVKDTFANMATTTFKGEERALLRGYLVEDETVGTIKESPKKGCYVDYTHNNPGNNRIWFFGAFGEQGLINIVHIPVHDHATIPAGGPAFGTYKSDYTQES